MSSVVLPKVVSRVTGIEVISVVPGWTFLNMLWITMHCDIGMPIAFISPNT
jgi:hypothetical protein